MTTTAAIIYEYQLAEEGELTRPAKRYPAELIEDTMSRLGYPRDSEDDKYHIRGSDGSVHKFDSPRLALAFLAEDDPDWLEYMRARFEMEV